MPLTEDRFNKYFVLQDAPEVPLCENVTVYSGGFIGIDPQTGYARPLVAGDQYVGIAQRPAKQGPVKDGESRHVVKLNQYIDLIQFVDGATQVNVGNPVYAIDDESLTIESDGNSQIGIMMGIDELTGEARIRCQPWGMMTGNARELANYRRFLRENGLA